MRHDFRKKDHLLIQQSFSICSRLHGLRSAATQRRTIFPGSDKAL
jgi:hypothetical protein